ncbi:VOC family protein [Neptuniibacter halophilus]|uniref:VOC family protein n=1 Tax=Neptuniibacter halophilus TaxID=651666 RepID=UPI0025730E5F|nr:VOC family protein [Neptuniibacter halophilus]
MQFSIQQLDHIVINTQDLDSSLAFYTDILGCELVRVIQEPALYQLRAGSALIDIQPVTEVARPGNMDHFCLQIKPFEPDALLAYMREHGVPCGQPEERYGATGFGQSVYIEDPEGNRIELKSA